MTTSSTAKNNLLPPGLVSNLQQVLLSRKGAAAEDDQKSNPNGNDDESTGPTSSSSSNNNTLQESNLDEEEEDDSNNKKPIVLVTNSDGIDSPGLTYLVQALITQGLYNVHVCAPQSDKSGSGHSLSLHETVSVCYTDVNGATAYEVSGTPVDCVTLALSGALFTWSKPLLVISGINRGSSCGHHMFYSSVVAGAREALAGGVPSLSISLNWKKDESQESDFKDAVSVCFPLITAAIRDIEKGVFPKASLMSIEVPTSPLTNKGFKITRQSLRRSTPNWQAISANRNPSAGRFMPNQQSLGMQLAQLGRDASAAGAARRLSTQKKNLEVVESVGVAGKSEINRKLKYFRLEFLDKQPEELDEDLDFRALENGFVAVTPVPLSPLIEPDTQAAASEWIAAAFQADQ